MPPGVPRASVHLLHTVGRRPETKPRLVYESCPVPAGRTGRVERTGLPEWV
jgi:hypothetical protein